MYSKLHQKVRLHIKFEENLSECFWDTIFRSDFHFSMHPISSFPIFLKTLQFVWKKVFKIALLHLWFQTKTSKELFAAGTTLVVFQSILFLLKHLNFGIYHYSEFGNLLSNIFKMKGKNVTMGLVAKELRSFLLFTNNQLLSYIKKFFLKFLIYGVSCAFEKKKNI